MNEGRVYLRAFEPEDYKVSIEWRNDDEIWSMVGGPKYFVSSEYEKKWIEESIFDTKNIKLAICLKENDTYIGNVSLTDIDWRNRNTELHILIGDKKRWNKGFGSEAIQLMLKYGFAELGLVRIFSRILEDNKASVNLFKKNGFVKEGVLRKAVYKNGEYKNIILMSILDINYF